MAKKKTYKDFADALYELKKINGDISYGRISQKTGILEATVNALANRRRANPPKEEVMKKLADLFNVEPDYFYENRLNKLLEIMDKDREFVDYCLRQYKKFRTESIISKAEIAKEELEEPEEEVEAELSKSKKNR